MSDIKQLLTYKNFDYPDMSRDKISCMIVFLPIPYQA